MTRPPRRLLPLLRCHPRPDGGRSLLRRVHRRPLPTMGGGLSSQGRRPPGGEMRHLHRRLCRLLRRTKLRLLQSLGATTRQPMPSHPLRMTHGATASRPLRVRSPTTSTQRRRSNNTTTSSCSRSSRIISSRHSSSHSSRRPRCRHRRASTVRRMPPRRRPPTHRPLHPHSSRFRHSSTSSSRTCSSRATRHRSKQPTSSLTSSRRCSSRRRTRPTSSRLRTSTRLPGSRAVATAVRRPMYTSSRSSRQQGTAAATPPPPSL
mmetsp:Transcript_15565/g.46969  ORF Transcript_15565/g.46969 Transcript_15565/m.46969 type:complete len:262 (+) Transcript_15565:2854-3639(+)